MGAGSVLQMCLHKSSNDKTECTLMCKDVPLYGLEIWGANVDNVYVTNVHDKFILSEHRIADKLKNRFAIFNRMDIKKTLAGLGLITKVDLLRTTHGVSLSDCLWVKFPEDECEWKDINPYRSEHTFDIGWFMEKDNPLLNIVLPNYSTDGTFPKCWITRNGRHYLIKAGTRGAYNAGLEPFSEVLFTQIADAINFSNYVKYDLTAVKYPNESDYSITGIIRDETTVREGRPTTLCECFCSEEYSLITAKELGLTSYAECLEFADSYTDNPDDLRLILLCDCIGLNEDRHFGNIGFLYSNFDYSIKRVSPMFDNNLSMLCYWDSRTNLHEYARQLRAKDSETFIDVAKVLFSRYPYLRDSLPSSIELSLDEMSSTRLSILNEVINNNLREIRAL